MPMSKTSSKNVFLAILLCEDTIIQPFVQIDLSWRELIVKSVFSAKISKELVKCSAASLKELLHLRRCDLALTKQTNSLYLRPLWLDHVKRQILSAKFFLDTPFVVAFSAVPRSWRASFPLCSMRLRPRSNNLWQNRFSFQKHIGVPYITGNNGARGEGPCMTTIPFLHLVAYWFQAVVMGVLRVIRSVSCPSSWNRSYVLSSTEELKGLSVLSGNKSWADMTLLPVGGLTLA